MNTNNPFSPFEKRDELKAKLHKLALQRSTPFCYSCYKDAKSGVCSSCGSDDLMRKVEYSGVEFGTSWIVKEILETELKPVDITEQFDQSLYDIYGDTTTIGWMEVDTVQAIKDADPISYDIAKQEYLDSLLDDEYAIEFYNEAYYVSDLEELVADIELEEEEIA